MIAALALVVSVAAVLSVVGVVWWDVLLRSRPDWVVRSQVRSQAHVTMISGESFLGIMESADRTSIVLVGAHETTTAAERPPKVDGRIVLPRARVAYVQLP